MLKCDPIIFKSTTTDKYRVAITNSPEILKRAFIEFSMSAQTGPNCHLGYIRMSEVDFEETTENICFYRLNSRVRQVRCLILYGDEPKYHITHVMTPDDFASKQIS